MFTVKMIMIDECGDEVVVDTFNVNDELDEDYMEMWEDMKIEKARERFPEARGFYFENSRDMQRRINAELAEFNGWKEEDDDEIEEWDDSKMMPCDYSGVCAGMSCPMYCKGCH